MESPFGHHGSSVFVGLLILLTVSDICTARQHWTLSEKAMFNIFETWNASNPKISTALNWSLRSNPCTNWSGVDCMQYNDSTAQFFLSDDVISLSLLGITGTYDSNEDSNYKGTFSLAGDLPAALQNLTSLGTLDLSNNRLNGSLHVISNMSCYLSGLILSNNLFSGEVPSFKSSIFKNNLSTLCLDGNQLNGSLDFLLDIQMNLQYINLSSNSFMGAIPKFNANTRVYSIDVSHNALSGEVDFKALGVSMPSLNYLSVDNNALSGEVDLRAISISMPSLFDLHVSNNNFSGAVDFSAMKGSFPHLPTLDLSNNRFNGTINFSGFSGLAAYDGATLNLSHNLFTNMSSMVTDVINFRSIDLSNNLFSNFTISTNSSLPVLHNLHMNNNLVGGEFPHQFFEIQGLQEVWFDNNRFTSLTLPVMHPVKFVLSTLSLVGNDISSVQYASLGPFSKSDLEIHNQVLWLGGNPYCNKIDSILKANVCRFNKSSPLHPLDPVVKQRSIMEIVLCTIASISFIVIVTFALIITRLYMKNMSLREIQQELAKQEVKPRIYSYNELKIATRDFHPDNKLGEGGFGVVYKGTLVDNTNVAVKQLYKSKLMLSDFLNEVVIISGVRHRNLIKLKGCCLSGDQRILVYEYVENKNLAEALWDGSELELEWTTRLNIILGIARGLAYLHEEVQPPIIHRDIKPPNILLDKNLNPKIADFGLAFLFPDLDEGQTHYTGAVIGTRGYLSPEYASFGHISTALDVFSFGIMILEIISGRKNIDFEKPPDQQILLQWAWEMYRSNELWHLVDRNMMSESIMEEIVQVMKIGLLCVQNMRANRPKMSTVVAMLLDSKQVENVCIVGESGSISFASFTATTTTSSLHVAKEEEEE